MATIATLTQKADGNLEGSLTTLNVTAPIALVPNARKAKENEPDYRIVSRKNGFELGAGWNRISKNSGERIHLGLALRARVRDNLRQRRSGAWRRPDRRRSSSGTPSTDRPRAGPANSAGPASIIGLERNRICTAS